MRTSHARWICILVLLLMAGHRQIFVQVSRVASDDVTSQQHTTPFNFGCGTWVSTATEGAQIPVLVAGTFRNMKLTLPSVQTKAQTFTLRENGSDTALTFTIPAGELTGQIAGVDVAHAAGGEIALARTLPDGSGATVPIGSTFSIEWEAASGNACVHGHGSQGLLSLLGSTYAGLLHHGSNPNFSEDDAPNLIAAPGTVTHWKHVLDAAPGAGKSYIFTIVKVVAGVGIEQDGTGGTPDTRITIADAETEGSATFSLPLVRGDLVYRKCEPVGSPAFARVRTGVVLVSDTTDQSNLCGTTNDGIGTGPEYNTIAAGSEHPWDPTEVGLTVLGAVRSLTLSGLIVAVDDAPGSGDAWTFLIRRNEATPLNGPSVTIADAAVTGQDDSGSVEIQPTDTASIQYDDSGTPTPTVAIWALALFAGEIDEALSLENALRGEDVALAWVEFEGQDDDGNDETFVWSGIALADPDTYYGGFKDAKLILVSDLVSAYSDRSGRLQATKASFELSDLPDADGNRSIAAFFDRSTGYVVRNTPITIRLISDRGRRALRTPVTIFRGMVDEASSVDEYRIRFECVSWLERRLDQPVVERRIGEDFPEADEDARQLPVPLCLGRLSDEASTTPGPVITDDEAGRGVFAILSDVIGYGDLGGDPPTSLVPVEDVGAGEVVAGRYYFMAWSIDATGAESDPEPFVPNANALDVSDDAAIDVTFTKGASAVTTRVAIGAKGPGTPLIYFEHILETAGTSVRFTRLIKPPTGYLNPHDATPGSIWPYGIGYRRLQVVAVVDGEETLPSIVVVAFIDPYHRPMRFAWEAVVDATEYRVYLASSNYRPNPPAFHFDRRLSVPITQTNSNGDPYVSALFTDPAWEVVDGLENVARGVVPLRFVGYFIDLTGRSVGGFLVAGHTLATNGIINLYQDQVVITDDHYTAGDYMAPGKPSFSTYFANTYQTINGHRYVLVYIAATGVANPNLDDAITGSRPLYANCYGADDVGDGTGAEITSKYQLLKLLLRNLLAPSVPVLGTNWLTASPTFADGVAMIDEASLDDAEAEAGNLIPNGPDGGRYLAVDLTWAQLFPDWCPSAKAHIGVTLQGQVRAGVINPDADSVVTVTEQREIIKGSFGWRDRAQAFGNAVAYQAVPVYSLSGISAYADADELEHTASQARHRGERNLQPALTLTWIREPGTARQIASAFLDEGAYLPREVRQSSVLHWVHRRLGDVIGVVHREGAARTGWTSTSPRKHAVLGIRISIPSNRVEYVCLDLRRHLGDLSDFELELLMSVIPLGGSMLDSCLEDPDAGSPVISVPPDWRIGVVNWDDIPSGGGAGSAYELVFDVDAKIQPGSPVGSPPPTVQPGLFLSNQSQIDTPVAAGTATSSAVRERQQIVVDRPVGGGVKSYWMLPILDNGAVATDAYVYGVLRMRKVGAE
jgi:hypothetical protein